ncbi:VOC family protein [Rhodoblastus acidophilus]|uniref:VOC family protein n=1 Tax=Candidatus Rhodoblastus alkanivorans TaxID=2954117 RepID=A0ABS9Z3G4_9HYPH|nr:VOC family protein [Candidatus Rhodoblastus alkanivorans]MCI4678058.1 VOC family protein [Candidatus Rhodoblastus alkanivorans]MCI4681601.1 VOC family protein [Candidatus Rhodoblastus alkanivorans]MDI4642649.1 VOC family protein [Rhodoblastus acidophilus]
MKFTPYVMFYGDCAEAFAFYAKVLEAKIIRQLRFSQAPAGVAMPPNADPDKIMHVALEKDGFRLMGGDMNQPRSEGAQPPIYWVSISVASVEEAQRIAKELSEGGKMFMPPGETFFSRQFAMFADRFSLHWMVDCPRSAEELDANLSKS